MTAQDKQRLAMLAENLDLNERLFRDGKRDAKTYKTCKRDAKRNDEGGENFMTEPCKYHPYRQATKRLVSWVSTSSCHAYPIDHGPRCQQCLDAALQRRPFSATWRLLCEPLPHAY